MVRGEENFNIFKSKKTCGKVWILRIFAVSLRC
nr:MAG TPA: replication protein E1 [Caudoviricetes sp.]